MNSKRLLRDWQVVALKSWVGNRFRGIVEVATAGGKTIFAIEGIKLWLEENPTGKILIIVPTTALQDQWYVSILDEFNLSPKNVSIWPENKNLSSQLGANQM